MNYPGAVDAVEVCEKLGRWDMYRRTAEVEGVASLKARMKQSLITAMNSMNDGRKDILSAALAQWDHPDFDKYLSAKIGMY